MSLRSAMIWFAEPPFAARKPYETFWRPHLVVVARNEKLITYPLSQYKLGLNDICHTSGAFWSSKAMYFRRVGLRQTLFKIKKKWNLPSPNVRNHDLFWLDLPKFHFLPGWLWGRTFEGLAKISHGSPCSLRKALAGNSNNDKILNCAKWYFSMSTMKLLKFSCRSQDDFKPKFEHTDSLE